MLPDIRAVIAAMLAAVGLLMISFGLVATYRVAEQEQAGSLHADLARRGQTGPPSADRPVVVIETPGPHRAPLAEPPESAPVETVAATPVAEPEPPQMPPPEPPVGGPLVTVPETTRAVAAENPAQPDTIASQRRAAAAKARKARAARIARERKAAARRAAQGRARQREAPAFGTFGGTFTAPR